VTTAVTVGHLLAVYGYWVVVVAVGVESLGVPVPGETTLIAAALYAGSRHRLDPVAVVVVAAVAAMVGDNIGYALGRVGGYRLLRRYGRYLRVDETKIKVGRYLFDRHGPKVVFLGRFVSILRTYAAFLAGINKMDWWRFLVYNALGAIVWATLFGGGAYLLGSGVHRLGTVLSVIGGVVAVAVIVVLVIVWRRQMGALRERAEAAYPGPLEPPGVIDPPRSPRARRRSG
jgi:membrane protein DedA with SNARE-associated domain